jgi:LysM repeat protein
MQCFRCDQAAVQECSRCGAVYCDDHGDSLCERCLDPASALPSYRVYRGSLVALLIGSVFAVWLLVRPGGDTDQVGPQAALAAVLPSPTATRAPAAPTTTSKSGETPALAPTPTAPPPASTPAPAPTPAENRTHTVRAGDTLTSIATQYRGGTDLSTFLSRIYSLNGLTEQSLISVGDVIRIPPS